MCSDWYSAVHTARRTGLRRRGKLARASNRRSPATVMTPGESASRPRSYRSGGKPHFFLASSAGASAGGAEDFWTPVTRAIVAKDRPPTTLFARRMAVE